MDIQKEIQKMIFIYNSLNNGWTVKKLQNNKFEFTKGKDNEEIYLEDYLKNFIKFNLDINNIGKQ